MHLRILCSSCILFFLSNLTTSHISFLAFIITSQCPTASLDAIERRQLSASSATHVCVPFIVKSREKLLTWERHIMEITKWNTEP